MYKFLPLVILSFYVSVSFGQIYDPKEAKEHFTRGNFPAAIKSYDFLIKKEPDVPEYRLNLAISHLSINEDKTRAMPHLEKVIQSPNPPSEAYFYYGKALHYAYRFSDAINAFEKYLELALGNDALGAKRQIETCNNAMELISKPLDVTFSNLGNTINTEYPDYYPIVPPDESFLVFTTRRKGGLAVMEFDGFYSSDVFMALAENDGFKNARTVGSTINTSYDEQAVGLSADGTQLFVYIDHLKEYGDIYLSERNTKSFGRKVKLGESVNSKEFETSGTISPDGNIMFFASRREGGIGGTDLYMTRKLPTGDWATPQNLGPDINTYLNEDFPYMLNDGKTLYFASQGHSSIGGYDIFTTVWDKETNEWSKPVNIGYPLNTPEDNMTIYFSDDGRTGYTSQYRKEGLGDLDVYRVTFNNVEAKRTLMKCQVLSSDTTKKEFASMITITDPETEDLVGTYSPNPVTNRYVIILPPGEYNVLVEAEGHKIISEKVVLFDNAGFVPELEKDFKLIPE